MSKRKIMTQKITDLQKQLKELELFEQQKVGSLVISMYEKNQIKDETLKLAIAKIIGDEQQDQANKSDALLTETANI